MGCVVHTLLLLFRFVAYTRMLQRPRLCPPLFWNARLGFLTLIILIGFLCIYLMDIVLSSIDVFDQPLHSTKPYLPFKRCGISEIENLDDDFNSYGDKHEKVDTLKFLSFFNNMKIKERIQAFSERRPYALPLACCVCIVALSVTVAVAVYMDIATMGMVVSDVEKNDDGINNTTHNPINPTPNGNSGTSVDPNDDDDNTTDGTQSSYTVYVWIGIGILVVGVLMVAGLYSKYKGKCHASIGYTLVNLQEPLEIQNQSSNLNVFIDKLKSIDPKKLEALRTKKEYGEVEKLFNNAQDNTITGKALGELDVGLINLLDPKFDIDSGIYVEYTDELCQDQKNDPVFKKAVLDKNQSEHSDIIISIAKVAASNDLILLESNDHEHDETPK